jgi:hypothetical protein
MIKILITDKLAKEGIDLINATEGFEAVVKTGIKEDELVRIIHRLTPKCSQIPVNSRQSQEPELEWIILMLRKPLEKASL